MGTVPTNAENKNIKYPRENKPKLTFNIVIMVMFLSLSRWNLVQVSWSISQKLQNKKTKKRS